MHAGAVVPSHREPVDRAARALSLGVTRINATHYRVDGGKARHIVVVLEDGTLGCDCPDHQIREVECAHMMAVALYRNADSNGAHAAPGLVDQDVPPLEPSDQSC